MGSGPKPFRIKKFPLLVDKDGEFINGHIGVLGWSPRRPGHMTLRCLTCQKPHEVRNSDVEDQDEIFRHNVSGKIIRRYMEFRFPKRVRQVKEMSQQEFKNFC